VEILLSAYEDAALNAAQRERVEEHLRTCAACQQTVHEMRMMARLLTEPLSRAHAPSDFAQRVMGALSSPTPPHSFAWGWKAWTVSAAVTLLLTFALWKVSQRRERRNPTSVALVPKELTPKQEREPQQTSPTERVVPKSPASPRRASGGAIASFQTGYRRDRVMPKSERHRVRSLPVVQQVAPPVTFSVRWDDRRIEQQDIIAAQVAEARPVVVERPPLVAESPTVTVTTDAESVESANGSES
jgi:anti-sigma factor RsiW